MVDQRERSGLRFVGFRPPGHVGQPLVQAGGLRPVLFALQCRPPGHGECAAHERRHLREQGIAAGREDARRELFAGGQKTRFARRTFAQRPERDPDGTVVGG